jgi:hypothetical protein
MIYRMFRIEFQPDPTWEIQKCISQVVNSVKVKPEVLEVNTAHEPLAFASLPIVYKNNIPLHEIWIGWKDNRS